MELTRREMTDLRSKILTAIVMPDFTTAETESSLEINFLIGKKAVGVRQPFRRIFAGILV